MQKQKLFKCINYDTPNLFKVNRLIFVEPAPGVSKAPKALDQPAGADTPVDVPKVAADKVQGGTDRLANLEAMANNAKGLSFLKRQNKQISQEKLTDTLKGAGYLNGSNELPSATEVSEAIKKMQRDLKVDDDGIIGKKTYDAMMRDETKVWLALNGEGQLSKKITAQTEKSELPADAKPKIEAKLSEISNAIQMNYKTIADLHGKLFNADGTFIQPTNETDLMGYKVALDNISGQLKTVNKIGGGLGEYRVPDNFTLTITGQSGDTASSRILRCVVHGEFSVPKAGLFAVDEDRGALNFKAYTRMRENFDARLAELKGDYDRVVDEWAKKMVGGKDMSESGANVAKFDSIFEDEKAPPVLILLGKNMAEFKDEVITKASDINLAALTDAQNQQLAQN